MIRRVHDRALSCASGRKTLTDSAMSSLSLSLELRPCTIDARYPLWLNWLSSLTSSSEVDENSDGVGVQSDAELSAGLHSR